jgi:hypothetical protein
MKLRETFGFLFLPRHAAVLWFVVLALISLFFIAWKAPVDPDLFWHIRAGSDIVQRGVPQIDWYSHTFSSFAWIDHEYAQEIFMHWVNTLGGLRLLSIVYAAIVALTFSVALKWALPRNVEWPWVLLAGVGIAFFSNSFLGVRPQMFTYVFLLLILGAVQRARESGRARLLWLIPLIFAGWANIHASFLLGHIVLIIIVATETLKYLLPRRWELGEPLRLKQLWSLVPVTLLSIVATFANPYGWRIWIETWRTLSDQALHKNIVEWFVPDIHSTNGVYLFGVAVIVFAVLMLKKKRADLTNVALLLAFFTASMMAVRNIPFFFIIAIPMILLALREMAPRAQRVITFWPAMLLLTVVVAGLLARVPYHALWRVNTDVKVFEGANYPVGAATYLADHPELADSRPFNDYAWGGYLLERVPWFRTFIDGRMPVWEQEGVRIIDEYFKIDRQQKDWQTTFEKYEIDLVVTRPGQALATAMANDARFTEAFKDEKAVIYIKKELLERTR